MKHALLLFILAVCSLPLWAQSKAPLLFYTDIDSGPAVGGEDGTDGAFVCVYGENFGSTRGNSTINIGGVAAAAYKLWTDPGMPYQPGFFAKACAQISHLTRSGNAEIQLNTANGASNPLPFTVRPGKIFFVAMSGDDQSGNGSGKKPWRSITHCKNKLEAGDICYVRTGVILNTAEKYNAGLLLNSSGQEGLPKAIVAYPGATVAIDMSSTVRGRGLESYLEHYDVSYWTLAGLSFNSDGMSVQINRGGYIRFVDNDVMCTGPRCNGPNAGLHTEGFYGKHAEGPGSVGHLWVFGNRIHDVGCHEDVNYANSPHPCGWHAPPAINKITSTSGTAISFKFLAPPRGDVLEITAGANAGQKRRILAGHGFWIADNRGVLDAPFTPDIASPTSDWQYRTPAPSKLFHNVYFSTNTNHVWFGWNSVNGNGKACRGIQFNSTGGVPQYDLHIHDNVIHDTVCDGINFASVDPSQGPVEAYNNVIYNAGTGPDPGDGPANYSCIYNAGGGDAHGPGGSGDIEIYNNTMYNCGDNPHTVFNGDRGAIVSLKGKSPYLQLVLTNNILVQPDRIPFVSASSTGHIRGSHNDCYGAPGGCPYGWSKNLDLNPGFVNLNTGDLRPSADSPLRQKEKYSIVPGADQNERPRNEPLAPVK
jgi:hypothetical protein